MDEDTQLALSRLVALAMDDGAASKAAADFLLAWWDVEAWGGFGPNQAWLLDDQAAADLARVFAFVARAQIYPDAVMDRAELEALARRWRPGAAKAV
ncbi:DUF7673 family protein [Caulobacter soli]|uniref:DUF7673 family protein n=1 Tax=Caulobacter soli TaxID=2708539 RepID=UPI001FE53C88|nr:hypothetical protein [Caulobacter soli]